MERTPSKEANIEDVTNDEDAYAVASALDQTPPKWSEIPNTALATDHGSVLSDEVLLKLFLEGIGVRAEQRQKLVDAILHCFGSLACFFSAEERALRSLLSVSSHLIPAVRLMQEAALRYGRARMGHNDILANREVMFQYLVSRLAREPIEQFFILFLDEKNRLIADESQTRGTVNHTPVYPREVARRAMELGAWSIVLVHNHPSGDPTPSDGDISMTRDLQRAAALIEVSIADHIIVGNGTYVSFRNLGLLSERCDS